MCIHWTIEEDQRAKSSIVDRRDAHEHSQSIKLRKMNVGGEFRNVTIRLVTTFDKIDAACSLINERYAWRGYGSNHRLLSDANHLTFTAEIDDEVVGTITLAIDSPHGLAADRAFEKELNNFRARPNAKICELTKFAFNPLVQSKELMAALFHIVFVYGQRTYGCTDLFIEVNPRHVRFYESMLGFERIGKLRANESVAAPAQLMRLEVASIRKNIDRYAGDSEQLSSRSLYPFFFSPADENGIYRRLIDAGVKPAASSYKQKLPPAIVIPRVFDAMIADSQNTHASSAAHQIN